ncbi:hypothetical protein IEO21_03032 [Rhodonia placenta]|uniref:Uncharacterized protein n=1 Tax=Rhodonia placenta TaxID=104341 RepID=A0A8H7P6K5_9APHY|nr:hypothetical protein IEO21_03032 [Postia placenta]
MPLTGSHPYPPEKVGYFGQAELNAKRTFTDPSGVESELELALSETLHLHDEDLPPPYEDLTHSMPLNVSLTARDVITPDNNSVSAPALASASTSHVSTSTSPQPRTQTSPPRSLSSGGLALATARDCSINNNAVAMPGDSRMQNGLTMPAPTNPFRGFPFASTSAVANASVTDNPNSICESSVFLNDDSVSTQKPASLLRPPPAQLPYPPFETMILVGTRGDLNKAFAPSTPPSAERLHPFATHDISERDWLCFLHNVQAVGSPSSPKNIVTEAAPKAMDIAMGMLIGKELDVRLRGRKVNPAVALVDDWNHQFFHPRRVHVSLAQGRTGLSGPHGSSPDAVGFRTNGGIQLLHKAESDSEDDSLVNAWMTRLVEHKEKKQDKKAAKKERKEQRRQQRTNGSAALGGSEPWRLVISFKP